MAPLRAPTMRSVPEMVFANAPRASRRTFSTPSSIAMLSAIASRVRPAVTRRLSTLRNASLTIAIGRSAPGETFRCAASHGPTFRTGFGPVQFREGHPAVEGAAEPRVVAREE